MARATVRDHKPSNLLYLSVIVLLNMCVAVAYFASKAQVRGIMYLLGEGMLIPAETSGQWSLE